MTAHASGTKTVSIPAGKMYLIIRNWSANQYQLQARCNGTASAISWGFSGPARGKQLPFTWNNWFGGTIHVFDDHDKEVLTLFAGRNYTSAAEEERNAFLLKSTFAFPTITL